MHFEGKKFHCSKYTTKTFEVCISHPQFFQKLQTNN